MIKESTKALWRLNNGTGWKHPILFLHAYWYISRVDNYVDVLMPMFNFLVRHFPQFGVFYLDLMIPYYHGKVVRCEDAKKIVSLDKDLHVDDSIAEKVIPFESARQIILENPDSIVVIDCGCRIHAKKTKGTSCSSAKYGIQTCMAIGEPQASFALDHSTKLNPKKITASEALDRMEDYHKNGWVHTIYFKDALGYRSYAMCNCCKCCCGAMHTNNKLLPALGYDKRMIIPSGYVVKTDEEKCKKGCLTCVKFCPFEARKVNPVTGKSELVYEKCYGCGVCIDKCSNGALSLVKDPNRGGEPLDIDRMKGIQT